MSGKQLYDTSSIDRTEGQETPVAVLHHELARLPGHVGELPGERHAVGFVLGVKRVRIFDKEVCVQQLLLVFVGIGCRRRGAAEVDGALIASHDGVCGRIWPRRIRPHALTRKAKLVLVISQRGAHLGGEKDRRDLTNHDREPPGFGRLSDRSVRQPLLSRAGEVCAR